MTAVIMIPAIWKARCIRRQRISASSSGNIRISRSYAANIRIPWATATAVCTNTQSLLKPYVIGGLDYASEVGATTASLSCNKDAEISKHATLPIEVDCGPEFLTGSTRLKSGTAQKLILNMISTVAMIGIGKVYNNLMVDVKPTNKKLVERSKRIIMQATECTYEQAEAKFEEANQDVKLAIVMILTDSSAEEGREKLAKANGFVKQTLN